MKKKQPLVADFRSSIANVTVARPPSRHKRYHTVSRAISLVPCSYSCRPTTHGSTLVVGEARRKRTFNVAL